MTNKTYFKTDEQCYINYQHNFPFHEKWGLKKTEAELQQDGFLVENFPEAIQQEGKTARAKYVNGEVVYEYEDIVAPVDEMQLLNDKLDNAILELTTLIAMGGM